MVLGPLVVFIVACILLGVSSSWLVALLGRFSFYLKAGYYTVTSLLMAVATSFPELFVGINSALKSDASLTFGNVIGANILNLTLIVGVATFLSGGIFMRAKTIKKDQWFVLLLGILPFVMILFDGFLGRGEGIVLVISFVLYQIYLFKEERGVPDIHEKKGWSVFDTVVGFIVALILLFGSAYFVVNSAKEVAIYLSIPEILIAIFMVSIGTTLPELAFAVQAGRAKKGAMVLGDAIGSVVCNSTLVLGIASIVKPLAISFLSIFSGVIFLIMTLLLFSAMVGRDSRLTMNRAGVLVLFYAVFVMIEFFL